MADESSNSAKLEDALKNLSELYVKDVSELLASKPDKENKDEEKAERMRHV